MRKVIHTLSWTIWIVLSAIGLGYFLVFIDGKAHSYVSNSLNKTTSEILDRSEELVTGKNERTIEENEDDLNKILSEIKSAISTSSDFRLIDQATKALPQSFDNKIYGQSYLVGDIDTGEILVSKNKDNQYPIASISKLMTAVIAKENIKGTDSILITQDILNTEGNSGFLKKGERILASDLYYPLLFSSSNDAAEAFADHYNRAEFLRLMNRRAFDIGLWHTYFNDPSGLSPKNISTSDDLFTMVKWIIKYHPEILNITREQVKNIKGHTWTNSNRFLNIASFLGGKNGFTDQANRTAIVVFELTDLTGNKRKISIILLKSPNRNRDVAYLLEYLKQYYGLKQK
jgi:D-alanyl-D-alanine carboxypeptidase